MLASMKAIPEAIKSWAENREQLYNIMACVAAVLVMIYVATGTRPLESIAMHARGAGISAVSEWLTVKAPPIVAARSEIVNDVALAAAGFLLLGMLVVPLLRGLKEENYRFAYEFLGLIGAPAAATIWVLLAVASQHGDIVPVLRNWAQAGTEYSLWAGGVVLVLGVLFLVARRYGLAELVHPLLRFAATAVYRVLYGTGIVFLAIVLAAVSLPISIIVWFASLEPDHHRKMRIQRERRREELAPQPTGALLRHVR